MGYVFTNDTHVLNIVGSNMWSLWIYAIFDSNKAVCMSVLRASGRPSITVIGNIASCWFVKYPLGIGLVFGAKEPLSMMWISTAAGWACCVLVYTRQ